jgi:hypothetical protein
MSVVMEKETCIVSPPLCYLTDDPLTDLLCVLLSLR